MQFLEYKPDIKLNNLIYSYYFIQNHATTHDNIPPLGHPVIQFHLRNNINTFFSNYDFPINEIMIVGQLSKFAKINNTVQSSMIGINLKPTALFKLLQTNSKVFTDKGTPAAQYFGNGIYKVLGKLKTNLPDMEKVAILDQFFISLIANKPLSFDKFDALIDRIIEKQANISMAEINNICPVSERTLQRYFNERIGFSMKTYLRVIRNLHFFKILNQGINKKILDIIFEAGYYDYSHFIKDFKLMTGITPKQYFSNNENFAKLFL
ncbi:MAG: AraC family transcriptional regulator [Chloroflexia bacterium]|nr:AraC family transcriptional regulator [Chloroflexia bacterium]